MKHYVIYIFLPVLLASVACNTRNGHSFDNKIYNNWPEQDSTVVFSKLSEKYWGHSTLSGGADFSDSLIESYTYSVDSLKNDTATLWGGGIQLTVEARKYSSYTKAIEALNKFAADLYKVAGDDRPKEPYGPSVNAYPCYYLISNQTIYRLSGYYTSVDYIDDCLDYLAATLSQGKKTDPGSIIMLRHTGEIIVK